MNNIARNFLLVGIVSLLVGMAWGIQMSASGDHGLSAAHAHLNLIGFVVMSIAAIYYRLTPAATGTMATVHFVTAVLGVVTIVPGIVMAVSGSGETLAKIGSVLTILSVVMFASIVWKHGFGSN
ncbi:MAG: hypothetical protein P8Q99_05425 [Paracoccaceae bacterium]|jgi:hypothetical protein|nr:hypothetical protein RB2150_17069 [Rhodobacterales bacterium HTCC2150] [Rhodobacteraceae bacterium HTCC2150]MDG1530776.1 hypothetical protein [Paracoccaceae bacterium]